MRMYPHGSGMFRLVRLCRLSSCGYFSDYLLSLSVVKTKSMENKEMDTCKLLYNTERVKLYIPEYGRNVQKMVDKIKTIEDREKRQECAETIISIMSGMFPTANGNPEARRKLWDHLAIMSDFALDIDYPCEVIKKEEFHVAPNRLLTNRTDNQFSRMRQVKFQSFYLWLPTFTNKHLRILHMIKG